MTTQLPGSGPGMTEERVAGVALDSRLRGNDVVGGRDQPFSQPVIPTQVVIQCSKGWSYADGADPSVMDAHAPLLWTALSGGSTSRL